LTTFILHNIHLASKPLVKRPETLLRFNHVDNFPTNTRSSISTPLDCQFFSYWYGPEWCYHYHHGVLLVAQRFRDQSFFLLMVCSSSVPSRAPTCSSLKTTSSKQLLFHEFTLSIKTTLLFPRTLLLQTIPTVQTVLRLLPHTGLMQTATSLLQAIAVYLSQASLIGNSFRHPIMVLSLVLPLPTHKQNTNFQTSTKR
jgi:hypothetical protein